MRDTTVLITDISILISAAASANTLRSIHHLHIYLVNAFT